MIVARRPGGPKGAGLPTLMSHTGGIAFDDPPQHASSLDGAEGIVRAAHAEMDVATAAFQLRTGLRCPDGCGACCLSPNVESSVIDVMPLATELISRGEAERVLHRIDERRGDRSCVLYEADPADPSRGRCSMYEWRPTICRLFGFAGRRDADGAPQFTPCRVHVQTMPAIAAATVAGVRTREIPLPMFVDLASPVSSIDPGPRGRLQPINHALREAIHTAALSARFSADQCDDDQTRPRTPSRPRRKAA